MSVHYDEKNDIWTLDKNLVENLLDQSKISNEEFRKKYMCSWDLGDGKDYTPTIQDLHIRNQPKWLHDPKKRIKHGDIVVLEGSNRIWHVDTTNSDGFHATTVDQPTRHKIFLYMKEENVRYATKEEMRVL